MTAQHMPSPMNSVEGADPTMVFSPDQAFGNNSAVVEGDTLYAYGGCVNARCGLAKVPLASVQDRAQWTFYTGEDGSGQPQWSTNIADAAKIIDSGGPAAMCSGTPG